MSEITKASIDELIAAGSAHEALVDLKAFFAAHKTLGNAQFVLTRMPKLAHLTPRKSARVAFLRTFTVEPAVPLLRASAALLGIDLHVQVGEFNTYAQDLLSPSGFLSECDPSIVILAAQMRDLLPDVWNRSTSMSAVDMAALCDRQIDDLRSYLTAFRSRSSASVVVHNLEQPEWPAGGVLDAQSSAGQSAAIRRFNSRLVETASQIPGVYVLDYDTLTARQGRARWHDEQKWLTARMPIAADCLPLLAEEYLRFIAPLSGKVCKALVCDLDNTLWGGVIGEDGMTGIRLDAEYPGAAHQALQRAVLDLHERGIILAVASKNNHADAIQAINDHPGMLLRTTHFAALRINWNDKAQSLREIAAELNIGIDAVAFIDDNPVERRRVQIELPEVFVVDLPEDPLGYGSALRACPVFERLSVTAEDKERGRYYSEQRERTDLAQSAGSLEDFYRSLEQVIEVAPVSEATLARVAQLTQKTNQFNLTTRRYTEQEIAALSADPLVEVISVKVADRFGDNGIVAVAILRLDSRGYAELDTFLMSCRVIGRTVETAVLAELMKLAESKGAGTIWGWFLPTAKNMPAAGFYESHGFERFECAEMAAPVEGASSWRFDLRAGAIQTPEWITIA